MRHLFSILFFFLSIISLSAKDFVQFDGQIYYSAYNAENDWMSLIEYVRQGEDINGWNKLVSVRVFKQLDDHQAYVMNVAKSVMSNPPNTCQAFFRKETVKERMNMDITLHAPDYVEWNLWQVYKSPDGLVVWLYAAKFRGDSWEEQIQSERERLIDEFQEHHFEVETE